MDSPGRYELGVDSPASSLESPPASSMDATLVKAHDQCNYTQEYIGNKKHEVLLLTKDYIDALGLHESLQEEMTKTFDFLFPLCPRRYNLHESYHLAEIIVFHVLSSRTIREKGEFDLSIQR